MKTGRVDHIGIAVTDIEVAMKIYTDILGLNVLGEETVKEQNIKGCFIACGDSKIELLQPTSSEGPVAKFIAARGEGIHHLAMCVDDLEAVLVGMKAKGVRMIDEKPRYGSSGAKIAFVHPKAASGVLLELVQR